MKKWKKKSEFKNKNVKRKGVEKSIKKKREERILGLSCKEHFIVKDITTTD